MRFFHRKSDLERLAETVHDSLEALSAGSKKGKILKTSLVAGGIAGLTAGSAVISSLRRRNEGS